MRLTTDRLTIRNWRPIYDAQQAFDIYSEPRVTRWLSEDKDQSIQMTQERLVRYCERTTDALGAWAVVDRAIDRVIGNILLVPLPKRDRTYSNNIQIGWHFRPASWGYGYATEAARAILQYGFAEVGLDAIYAVTLADNLRSQRVMARLGMEALGATDDYYNHTLELYSLTAQDYSSGQLSSMADKVVSMSAPLT
ncbi:MAG: GNAT family N-acetyltransferase [Cyanobacteria bacterium P01_D01_bin.56]